MGLEMECPPPSLSLSLWEPCEGNLKEGLLQWGPWRIYIGRLWRWASLSIWPHWGTWRQGSFTRNFERERVKEGSENGMSLFIGAL